MKLFANDARLQAADHIGSAGQEWRQHTVLLVLLAALSAFAVPAFGGEEGVAVGIVYDTSGSMKEQVKDSGGKMTPKYVIANRALKDIVRQIQTFTTNNGAAPARKVEAGVFVFHDRDGREAVPMGPFDPAAILKFAQTFSTPLGSTPLGNAVNMAGRAVMKSNLNRKHVLVITDGQNTSGPDPAAILPRLKQQAAQGGSALSVHFVAFDVSAKVFDAVKKQGATVVGASDEKQLNSQLEFIMQRKILLEEEEPAKKQ